MFDGCPDLWLMEDAGWDDPSIFIHCLKPKTCNANSGRVCLH